MSEKRPAYLGHPSPFGDRLGPDVSSTLAVGVSGNPSEKPSLTFTCEIPLPRIDGIDVDATQEVMAHLQRALRNDVADAFKLRPAPQVEWIGESLRATDFDAYPDAYKPPFEGAKRYELLNGYAPAPGKVDHHALMRLSRDLLRAIGEDPDRPGLEDTPRRYADWWREFIEYDPGSTGTVFEQTEADQLVLVSGMRVWSLCEHHLLPFWTDVAIAYIAGGHVLGLSKFGRIAHQFAHRLQLQEQLSAQIADEVSRLTGSRDVAVVATGEHLCMSMRGIKTPARMTSSVMRGRFREEERARAEVLQLIALARG